MIGRLGVRGSGAEGPGDGTLVLSGSGANDLPARPPSRRRADGRWTAVLPPANNPFMDDHLIYAGPLVAFALTGAGDTLGLGRTWRKTALVRRFPWLA